MAYDDDDDDDDDIIRNTARQFGHFGIAVTLSLNRSGAKNSREYIAVQKLLGMG